MDLKQKVEGVKMSKIHSFKKSKDDEKSYKVETTFDFEGVELEDVFDWAMQHLTINRTRVYRTWDDDKLDELVREGSTVLASEAGKGAKVDVVGSFMAKFGTMSPSEQEAALRELERRRAQGKGIRDND